MVVAPTWSLTQNKLSHMNKVKNLSLPYVVTVTVGNGLNKSTTQCQHTIHLMYITVLGLKDFGTHSDVEKPTLLNLK